MINENQDDGEKSPFDDPDHVLYEDPNDPVEQLSLEEDTEIVSVDSLKNTEAYKANIITLNPKAKHTLLNDMQNHRRVISAYPQSFVINRLFAHYCIKIIDELMRSDVCIKTVIEQRLKNEKPVQAFPYFDQDTFNDAFAIMYQLNGFDDMGNIEVHEDSK